MATLSTRQRDQLPESAFAFPERRALPIHDAAHVRAAVARFASTAFPSMAASRKAATRILRAARRFGVEIGEASAVRKVAGKVPDTGKRKRRNPGGQDQKALKRALNLSRRFHGTDAEVVELEPSERQLSRYAVVAGELDDFTYAPAPRSKRGDTAWRHESGDRGAGHPKSENKPLVVVDPITKRLAVVANKSPMKFSSRRGFVG